MKGRVFISGVAGLIGSHLAERWLRAGNEVVGIDNLSGGLRESVPAGVRFAQVDCRDLAATREAMRGAEVVYHTAAAAYEGLSVFSPHLVTQSVVTGSTSMISAALATGVRRFVLCSSMARYGAIHAPFTEDMTPRPDDPYGIAKLASEHLLQNLAETHGMEWVVAIPHNVIGPRQKYDDPYRNVAGIFIHLLMQGRQPFLYGDGKQKRCFSFVSDVVDPLMRMGTDDAARGEVFNIGPDDEFITVVELAETIARLLDVPFRPTYLPARPREVRNANCSAEKARKRLGYAPKVKLDDGLRTMIDWVRSRGPRPFDYRLELEIPSDRTPATWRERLF